MSVGTVRPIQLRDRGEMLDIDSEKNVELPNPSREAVVGNKVAIVFCAHHKPWLMMSTLLTTLMQDYRDVDFFFLYHLGDGTCPDKSSYAHYHRLAATHGIDPQVSPYDERVRSVCQLSGLNVRQIEFENDSSLDSGAWYKFIRTGLWRPYEYVFFVGEGTLFTRQDSISSMVRFASIRDVHFIASGHEKRRFSKLSFLSCNRARQYPTAMDIFHDEMTARVFATFCRDPVFQRIYETWPDEEPGETQNHVPDIWPRGFVATRIRSALDERGTVRNGTVSGRAKDFLRRHRRWFIEGEAIAAGVRVGLANGFGCEAKPPRASIESPPRIHVNGRKCLLSDTLSVVNEGGVRFHRVEEPEWFGCTVAHLMSRTLLERLADKLERFSLYDTLDVPFAGTALEVVWGFLPAWLGFEKWFADGFHRVRKNFVSYRREDDPETMASYVNRYHRGRIAVAPRRDAVKVRALHRSLRHLRTELGPLYF